MMLNFAYLCLAKSILIYQIKNEMCKQKNGMLIQLPYTRTMVFLMWQALSHLMFLCSQNACMHTFLLVDALESFQLS